MRNHLLAVLVLAAVAAACADSQTATPEESEAVQPTEEAAQPVEPGTDVAAADQEALDRVVAAAQNTVEAGTARFTLSVEAVASPDVEDAQVVAAEGEEDFENQQRLITFTGQSGELQTVVDDTTVYVELPATEGDDWARIELDELLDDVGFGGPAGLPFQRSADNLAVLEQAVATAAEGDSEEVQGANATRYDLTIDLTTAAQTSSGEANDTFSALAETSGLTELGMAVWINDDEQVSRITYNVDLAQAEDVEVATDGAEADVQPTGEVSVTVEYYDIGDDLTIEIPDEANIVDIDEDEIRDSLQQ